MWRMSRKIFWLVINSGLIMFGHFSATFQFWRRLCCACLCVCLSLFLSRTSGSDSMKNFNFLCAEINRFAVFQLILFSSMFFVCNLYAHTAPYNSLVNVTFHATMLMYSLMSRNMWHFDSPKGPPIAHRGYIGEFPTGNFPATQKDPTNPLQLYVHWKVSDLTSSGL